MQPYGHDDDDIDLRWCKRCGKYSYLRKNACVNSTCVGSSDFESMSLPCVHAALC